MSKFTSVKRINTRWRNNDFIGEPGSSHTFADALHEEFLVDWAYQIQIGDIVITETPTTGNIQMSTLTVGDIVLTGTATGNFGGGGPATVVQGTAPISVSTSSNTATVSLNANYSSSTHDHSGTYQPAGTYVTSVAGAAPISTTGTTSVTVSIDTSGITGAASTYSETLRAYVKNTTGVTIPKGSAVYISGSTGDNALISLATASTEIGSSKTLGITASAISTDGFGYVIENGLLAGINTSTATAGQAVWLGNTPGSLVFGTPPAEPSHSVYLGVVIRVQQNNGEILVKVQNGYEIDELHDVSAASPSDGDIIQYKNTSGLWTKQSISQAGINKVYYQTSQPTGGTYNVGDLWIDSDSALGGPISLTDSVSSTSTTTAATPNSVKSAYDLANTAVQRDVFSLYEFGNASVIGTLPRFTLTTTFSHTRNAVYYQRLVAHRNFTVSNISVTSSATASSGLTACRLGIYTRSGTTFTLVAQTASDTTIGNTTNTKYTRALATAGGYPATYDLVAGSEYWIGFGQHYPATGATGASWVGAASRIATASNAATGIQQYQQTGQSDLPASGTGTESSTNNGLYLEVS